MVNLRKAENGNLEITADDFDAIAECSTLEETLEYHLCNGWSMVRPEEIGAMIDGLIISDDTDRDDSGELTYVGVVYWFADYAVVDVIDTLLSGEIITLIRR